MTKSRRLRWAVHAAQKGERKNIYKVLVGMKEKKNSSEDLGVDRRIILKWSLKKMDRRLWIQFIWLSTGTDD
jgi:hypothetical protein